MLAQYGDDARCLVQITGARIDLDQFHPRLLTQFLVVEMRKGILQVNAWLRQCRPAASHKC